MPTLVQIGAGAIGRSLVGQLFSRAGWEVVFLDVFQPVVEALNARKSYTIGIKDTLLPGQPDHMEITNVSAILLGGKAAAAAVARADLVGTSVGAANLPAVCRLLADALADRPPHVPLPVMLCENLHNAGALAAGYLRDAVGCCTGHHLRVHFIEAAISKMVPPTPREQRDADPLAVSAEAYNTLYLDADGYPGTPPVVPGVAWRQNFAAYVDRKLLLHNFGHAAAAYNGYLAGKRFIWECAADPGVLAETAGCMMETSRALAIRHAGTFTFDENRAWADDLLRRFRNVALADPVYRVGRDLRRKLAPDDRCIGALRLLMETGLDYSHTARAIAAALHFQPGHEGDTPPPGDEEVVRLAAEQGPEAVLTGLCGLAGADCREAVALIAGEYRRLGQKGKP